MIWGILGTFHFSFFGLRGVKIFGRVAKGGGEKFWTRREGGRKILDRQFFWNPKGSMNMLLKMRQK